MAISRFDEGTLSDALVAYWNAGESAIDKTGNTVNSVTSVYGKSHPLNLTNPGTGTAEISHGLTTMGTGNLACFEDTGASSVAKLQAAIPSMSMNTQGMGIVTVIQRDSTGSGNHNSVLSGTDESVTRCGNHRQSGSSVHRFTVHNGVKTSVIAHTTNPDVIGVYQDAAVDSAVSRVNTTEENWTHSVATRTMTQATFFNLPNPGATSSLEGKMSIMLIYDRMLTAQERADVHELCQYWVDNGEAPSTGPEPTVTFGPVATNDDPSVTGWQWEESSDGVAWADVGTILTDVTGATTTSLTVNSATMAMDQTQVRCVATSAKEPLGVPSAAATLTVQAAN